MTVIQKRKILQRIVEIEEELEKCRQARLEIINGGVQSATMSSGGGSRSYTNLNLEQISNVMNELTTELCVLRKKITNNNSISRTIYITYI